MRTHALHRSGLVLLAIAVGAIGAGCQKKRTTNIFGSAGSAPVVETVGPSRASSGAETPVVILGEGLAGATAVSVGGVALRDVSAKGDNVVLATLPAGVQPGTYDVL